MTIFGRLVLLTTSLLCLVALASGAGWMATSNGIESTHNLVSRSVAEQEAIDDATIGLLQSRRAEKDFLVRRQAKYIERLDAQVALTTAALERAATASTGSSRADGSSALIAQVRRYARTFHTVVEQMTIAGLNHKSGEQGKLRKVVHAVEKTVRAAKRSKLTELLLMCRRHEKDYLLRHDPKYQAKLAARVVEFNAALERSPLPSALRTELTAQMSLYERTFNAMVTAMVKAQASKEALRVIAHQIEASLVQIADDTAQAIASTKIETVAAMRAQRQLLLWGLAPAIVLGLGIGLWIVRSITGPVRALTASLAQITEDNDLTQTMHISRHDEVGQLADNINAFLGSSHRALTEVDVATGQVRERATGLIDAASTMRSAAETASGEISDLTREAVDIAENTQTMASSIEALRTRIDSIARSSSHASQVAVDAVDASRQTRDTIDRLAQSCNSIGDLVAFISNIAGQSNLLALNATIEAARAGEAGKGFAVVANEVRELAHETAEASERITKTIDTIQSESRAALDAVVQISSVIAEIGEVQISVGEAVSEQSVAVNEIAGAVNNVSDGSGRIASRLQMVLSSSQRTFVSATDTEHSAGELLAVADRLRLQVDQFVI